MIRFLLFGWQETHTNSIWFHYTHVFVWVDGFALSQSRRTKGPETIVREGIENDNTRSLVINRLNKKEVINISRIFVKLLVIRNN